jgi:hypothetical protein
MIVFFLFLPLSILSSLSLSSPFLQFAGNDHRLHSFAATTEGGKSRFLASLN